MGEDDGGALEEIGVAAGEVVAGGVGDEEAAELGDERGGGVGIGGGVEVLVEGDEAGAERLEPGEGGIVEQAIEELVAGEAALEALEVLALAVDDGLVEVEDVEPEGFEVGALHGEA